MSCVSVVIRLLEVQSFFRMAKKLWSGTFDFVCVCVLGECEVGIFEAKRLHGAHSYRLVGW